MQCCAQGRAALATSGYLGSSLASGHTADLHVALVSPATASRTEIICCNPALGAYTSQGSVYTCLLRASH